MGSCLTKLEDLEPQQSGYTSSTAAATDKQQQRYQGRVVHQSRNLPPQLQLQLHQLPEKLVALPPWKPAAPAPSPKPVQEGDTILGKPCEDIKLHYTIGNQRGKGQSGVTFLCTENSTGKRCACKTISKKKLVTKEAVEDIRREVQIMQHLSGQPNIVEFKGAYEDRQSVHLVMELCAGGDLFDRIKAKGRYSEEAAAFILRQIINAVNSCHLMGVMHRDLKPENFLLSSKDENAVLKVTDFGFSVFIEEGKIFRDAVGTPYYVAPEVLRREHGKEADIWSAGVMLYILLSGVLRFGQKRGQGYSMQFCMKKSTSTLNHGHLSRAVPKTSSARC
ncbi:hypothetical protein SLA2020_108170 [Shorea laevis]